MNVKRKVSDRTKMHNKIFLRNPINPAFDTHEIIKTIMALRIYKVYKNSILFLATEYELDNGDLADVYVEFWDGSHLVYEIQKEITPQWTKKIIERDKEIGTTTKIIPLKDIEKNIGEINWIDKYL